MMKFNHANEPYSATITVDHVALHWKTAYSDLILIREMMLSDYYRD